MNMLLHIPVVRGSVMPHLHGARVAIRSRNADMNIININEVRGTKHASRVKKPAKAFVNKCYLSLILFLDVVIVS